MKLGMKREKDKFVVGDFFSFSFSLYISSKAWAFVCQSNISKFNNWIVITKMLGFDLLLYKSKRKFNNSPMLNEDDDLWYFFPSFLLININNRKGIFLIFKPSFLYFYGFKKILSSFQFVYFFLIIPSLPFLCL